MASSAVHEAYPFKYAVRHMFQALAGSLGLPNAIIGSAIVISLGKLKTRNGQVRTAAEAATPPINVPMNLRLSVVTIGSR